MGERLRFNPKNIQIMCICQIQKKLMMCEHKCIKFCILTKGFYYFDSNSHRRRGLIGPTDGLYEKSEMLLHFINTSMVRVTTLLK